MSEQTFAINNFERDNMPLDQIKRLCKIYTSTAIEDEPFRQIISALNQTNPDNKIVTSCRNVLSKIYDTFSKKNPPQKDFMRDNTAQDNFNCEAITYCCIGTGCIACGLPCLLVPPLCTANPMTTLPLISEGVGALCTIGGCCMDMAACKLSALASTLSSIQEIKADIEELVKNNKLLSEKATIAQYQQKLTNILNDIDQLAPNAATKENVCELIYDVLEINECMQALDELCEKLNKDATTNIDINYYKGNMQPISNENNNNDNLNNMDININVKK